MYGVRSFDSVPTCSGWGFSHIERFRPLRMTIRGERMGSHLGDTRQCNKDPSASLGMTVLGERIGSQGRFRRLF